MFTCKSGAPASTLIIGGKEFSVDKTQIEDDFVQYCYAKHQINSFYVPSSPASTQFINGIRELVETDRENILLIGNAGSPTSNGKGVKRTMEMIRTDFEKRLNTLNTTYLDVLNIQYIQPEEDVQDTLDIIKEVNAWKMNGKVRYVMFSCHDFEWTANMLELAYQQKLINNRNIDYAMLRYNMAHRSAEKKCFNLTQLYNIPVLAFTTTRWNTLQAGHRDWDSNTKPVPNTADCISYAMTHPAVGGVINSIRTKSELDNVMSNLWKANVVGNDDGIAQKRLLFEEYGSLVYNKRDGIFDNMGTSQEKKQQQKTKKSVTSSL